MQGLSFSAKLQTQIIVVANFVMLSFFYYLIVTTTPAGRREEAADLALEKPWINQKRMHSVPEHLPSCKCPPPTVCPTQIRKACPPRSPKQKDCPVQACPPAAPCPERHSRPQSVADLELLYPIPSWMRKMLPCSDASEQVCLRSRTDSRFFGHPMFRERLRQYVRTHNSMLKPGAAGRRQFVVFNATNDGVGNKLLPFVSTFALALLLNRTLLVDWPGRWPRTNPGHIKEFLSPPDGIESWILEDVLSILPGGDEQLGSTRWTELNMRTPGANPEKLLLLCEDLGIKWKDKDVLVVPGDQYFLPMLFFNPRYRKVFANWFDSMHVFGPLARFLLRPSVQVAQMLQKFRHAHFSSYNVGLQIRSLEWVFSNPNLGAFWDCTRTLLDKQRGKVPGGTMTVFVATDSFRNRNAAKRALEGNGIRVVFPDHRLDRNSIEGVRWAFTEIFLLSACDDIVVTSHSTFGAVAHGIGSLFPHRVAKGHPKCRHVTTSEPSPHFWTELVSEKSAIAFKCLVPEMDEVEGPW